MEEEVDVTVAEQQLKEAGTDPSKQVLPLYQLGEWYLKKAKATANAADFTKAAGLYNAALVRSRLVNHEIDEEQIFKRIVKTTHEFLCIFGSSFGSDTKARADEIRNEIDSHKEFVAEERRIFKKRLNDIDSRFSRKDQTEDQYKIHADKIQDLFCDIQDMYIRLMSMFTKECESKLGEPPCKYAIIALGSVARMEATPYSDLEFAILYENPAIGDKIDYFRVLTYLLHLKVINLGETILPALGIKQLNDFEDPKRNWFYDSETPRGISFDGAMPWASKTPLGIKATNNNPALELIRTPKQMAELQDEEETAVKEAYHLADIMTRVAILFGEQALVAEYNERVAEKLAVEGMSEGKSSTVGLSRGIQQLLDDTATYDPFDFCLGVSSTMGAVFDAKNELYRLISLVLSDLGLIFNIRISSPWQVISELQTQGIIDESVFANMKVCLSIANEIRLKTYFAYERQKEVLSPVPGYTKLAEQCSNYSHTDNSPCYPDFDEDVVVRLLSTSFDIGKRCQEFCIKYIKYNEIDIGILRNPCPLHFSPASLKGRLYLRLQNFPKALESMESISEDSADYPDSLYGQGVIYLYSGKYGKSVKYLEKALEAHFKNEEMSNLHVIEAMNSLAMALVYSGEYGKAKLRREEAIHKHDEIYGQGSITIELCSLMHHLGLAYADLGNSALALETFQKVEKMQNSLTDVPDNEIVCRNIRMAYSLSAKNQYAESLEYVEKALDLCHKLFGKHNLSIDLALIYTSAGHLYELCLVNDEAVSWYERSLELFNLLFGKNPCEGKIFCLMHLGVLQFQASETNKAIESLQDALAMARTFYHDRPHFQHALVLISLGEVMQKNKKFCNSLQYFEEAKEIMDKISEPNRVDPRVAKILYNMGNIYDELGNLPAALQSFKDAFSLYSVVIKQNEDINETPMAIICSDIGYVSRKMRDFKQAKDYFTKAAVIFRKIPLTKPICSNAVDNLLGLHLVCENIGETNEALKYLEEARDVAKAIEFKHVMVLNALCKLSKKYNNEMGSFVKFRICFEEFIEMANYLKTMIV